MAAPKGYREADHGVDHSKGYTSLGELYFDDMWCAFTTENCGVVGGQKTVDDYTPEGLDK